MVLMTKRKPGSAIDALLSTRYVTTRVGGSTPAPTGALAQLAVASVPLELRRFREYLEPKARPGTISVYVDALARWLSVLDGDTPTVETAQRYVNSLARILSPSTVNLRAHAIIKYFKSKGIRIELDCPTVRYPEPKYKSMQEIRRLIRACRTPLEETLITVLFDSAVRISELLNLEVADINWDYGLISVVRKGGRREEVNVSPRAMAVLHKWLDSREMRSSRVFGDLDYGEAWRITKRVGRRVRMDLSPHMLRHSRAIQMLMSGNTLGDVQNHLGHVNIATTANIYGRFKAMDLKGRIPAW
jgi:integrase